MRFNPALLALIVFNAAGQVPYSPYPAGHVAAREFVTTHRAAIDDILFSDFSLDTDLAISVALPEIARYSRLRDLAETSALQVFYIQLGDEYADFSIGKLQMKPSFAASLESSAYLLGPEIAGMFAYDTKEPEKSREARVDRLCNTEWQLRYLGLFCRLVGVRLQLPLTSENLAVYAGAYNLGWQQSTAAIMAWNNEHNFPSGHRESSDHSYAALAVTYYDILKTPIHEE